MGLGLFGGDWVHIKDCLGFMWIVVIFGLGKVGLGWFRVLG